MDIQSKFGDFLFNILRDTCEKVDDSRFLRRIFPIFGFGENPNINQINYFCGEMFLYNHPFDKKTHITAIKNMAVLCSTSGEGDLTALVPPLTGSGRVHTHVVLLTSVHQRLSQPGFLSWFPSSSPAAFLCTSSFSWALLLTYFSSCCQTCLFTSSSP